MPSGEGAGRLLTGRSSLVFVLLAAGVAAGVLRAAAGDADRRAAAPGIGANSGAPAAAPWEWRLPPGFPEPRVPADNPMSAEKVALGRRLFHDRRLSRNETQACADCHRPALAFTDGLAHALGSTGVEHRRSAPSLANVAYAPSLTWADPKVRRLEEQARIPLFGTDPVEMGFGGHETELTLRLRADQDYAALFRAAFPGEAEPVTLDNLTRALASFERTLVSGNSAYDRLVYQGKMDALSDSAWRGMRLFYAGRPGCSGCHGGLLFSGGFDYGGLERPAPPRFLDNGLLRAAERRGPDVIDAGLARATGRRRDGGLFKVPTLRNIALTAPYMHDGRIATLAGVLDHYARVPAAHPGGNTAAALTPEEREDLLAFLASLTDETFVSDPAFAAP
jgi:cytochrome c peroxidase